MKAFGKMITFGSGTGCEITNLPTFLELLIILVFYSSLASCLFILNNILIIELTIFFLLGFLKVIMLWLFRGYIYRIKLIFGW